MTFEKFTSETQTLQKFFTLYCHEKHLSQKEYTKTLHYHNKTLTQELFLCEECFELIEYSFEKLQACPHEIKPRCRTCPNPCYDKKEWKALAKIMRYSGMQLGILKIKKFFFKG